MPEQIAQLVEDDEYHSEKLLSENGDSDNELGERKSNYKKFNEADMCKEFKFKLGMEFSSLK